MQSNDIIEKAKKLGLDTGSSTSQEDNLRLIASQVGLDDFDATSDMQKLESILDEQLSSEMENRENISNGSDGLNDYNGSDYRNNQIRNESFGQKEYDAAKNKNGVYDKNHYKRKQEELDNAVEDAKKEKEKATKDVTKKEGKVPVTSQKNKNVFDKARDNLNLAKRRQDAITNKLNAAKANAYNMTHPGEALKDKAEAAVKEKAKEVGKKAGDAAKKGAAKAGKAAGKAISTGFKALAKVIASNPIVLAIILVVVLILFILLFMTGGKTTPEGNFYGLMGYDLYEGGCSRVSVNGDLIDIEEYISVVVSNEVGGMPDEILKTFAVAARTVLVMADNKVEDENGCYYKVTDTSDSFQVYNPSKVFDSAIAATEATRGVIITVDGKAKAYYDASCMYTAEQARSVDSSKSFNSSKMYLKYGSLTIGGNNFQEIDESKVSSMRSYNTFSTYINSAKSGSPCRSNHGYGISANGAAYLYETENKDWKGIISYYYNGQESLQSIYQVFGVSTNWTQEISTGSSSTIPTTIMSTPIRSLLSDTQYNELNNLIFESVKNAGVGTRGAIVASAVTPIKYLAENFNVVIPYTMGGGHYMTITSSLNGSNIQKTTATYYGVDPDWGTKIRHSYGGRTYYSYGPDCSSWVPWVYYNAGINMGQKGAGDFVNLGTKHTLGGSYIAQPGDILENSHHVTVVVGVDTENSTYYIAHARGGDYGTVITPVSFNSTNYYAVDMSDYISRNMNSGYESNYGNGVLSN